MTNDHLQNVQDDIAYMRAMAQEGRNAPLLNGPIMVAAGTIFGVASLCQWTIETGVVDGSPWAQLWVWVGAAAIFTVALTMLIRRQATRPGARSAANKAVGAAWTAVGFGIFATWLTFMAVGFTSGDWAVMRLMPSVVAVAYGSAWVVAGAMACRKWLSAVGVASYAGAVLLGVVAGGPAVYLVYAGLLVVAALLPGLALMRQEPSEVI